MNEVKWAGSSLYIGDKTVVLASAIKDAFPTADKVIVLLDPDARLGKSGPFRNLLAFDRSGRPAWIAELPTDKPSDVFTRVASREPLRVDSFSSFECLVDPCTGKLLAAKFFK